MRLASAVLWILVLYAVVILGCALSSTVAMAESLYCHSKQNLADDRNCMKRPQTLFASLLKIASVASLITLIIVSLLMALTIANDRQTTGV